MKIKIQDLKNEIEKNFDGYEEYITDYYGSMEYVNDIIQDIADNNIDIYNYDLLEWVKNNWEYVEQYVQEFGIDSKNFNFFDALRGGQYLQLEETLHNNKSEMLEYLAYYIILEKGIEEIEEEKATEISMINYDMIDEIWELEEKINDILEIEAEE